MRLQFLATTLLCSAIVACSNQAPTPTASDTTAKNQPPTATPAPAKAKPHRITPEEIAAIEASGKTGLWSDVAQVCAKDAKAGVRTTLSWNVKASGAEHVVVYVVDKSGKERNFGQGGPIGMKQTGPWLHPGTTFKIRAADGKQELGSVVIGDKPC